MVNPVDLRVKIIEGLQQRIFDAVKIADAIIMLAAQTGFYEANVMDNQSIHMSWDEENDKEIVQFKDAKGVMRSILARLGVIYDDTNHKPRRSMYGCKGIFQLNIEGAEIRFEMQMNNTTDAQSVILKRI